MEKLEAILHADPCNADVWKMTPIVNDYAHQYTLQTPEALILIRYKQDYLLKDIIDLGCGAGRTSRVLIPFARRYVGIDYSAEMLAVGRKALGTQHFVHGDMRNLSSFDDASFDFALIAYNGIDCMAHNDRIKTLQEVNRVLKPHALFVFSSHNRNYSFTRMRPQVALCKNPITLIKNFMKYCLMQYRYCVNKKKELHCEEYAITRNQDFDFRGLCYTIDTYQQIKQAASAGFDILETYDTRGTLLDKNSDDTGSCWIYYVARKS